MPLLALLILMGGCAGPSEAAVSGVLFGSYPCASAGSCRRPLGNQPIVFRPQSGPSVSTRTDVDGGYAVRLGGGTWTALVGGVEGATPLLRVTGYPGERITLVLSIPIEVGGG